MKYALRYYRKKAGFTLDELAEASGLGSSTIGNVETGTARPGPDFWPKLEKALRIPREELMASPTEEMEGPGKRTYGKPRAEDQAGVSVVREETSETNWESRARTAEAKLEALQAALESLLNQFRK